MKRTGKRVPMVIDWRRYEIGKGRQKGEVLICTVYEEKGRVQKAIDWKR